MATTFGKPSLQQRIVASLQTYDGPLLLAALILSLIGLITMYSAGADHGTRFVGHARNLLIAAVVMFAVAQIPPQRMMALAIPMYTVGVALLFAVEFFGIERKGSQRWLNIGVVIQPSEIMKVALPLMMAWWFQRREGQIRALDYVVAAVLLMVPWALIFLQPDLGTSLLVLASGLFVLFFAGLSWKLIIPPVFMGLVGVVVLIVMEDSWCAPGVDWVVMHDYQRIRVCTLLDPFQDPLGKGFHIIQGMIAIGSGGAWGKGYMQGTQTHLEFIPERTTDFIFAAFSEEFGLIGFLALALAFVFLIGRALTIALEGPTLFARLLAGAMALNIFVYVFVNMGMVSGILPVVGVPLPFVSYGGTAMVTLGFGLGILLSVAKAKRLMQS
ncbi:MAG: rod shape-determining protein RodA [Hydrogenophaga sp.]